MILAYAATQIVGMSVYGTEAWSRYGDAFGVYFDLFSRLSPLHWERGELRLRLPLGGAPKLDPVPGTVAAAVHDDRHDVVRRVLAGAAVDRDQRARASSCSIASWTSASTPRSRSRSRSRSG